ncbi:site-specific integrase [Rubritalea spongiae]|uniref:site-specific integrase n=1 Tax=Rubritalea spongiae TaxID=430797 RepID=UPI003605E0AA
MTDDQLNDSFIQFQRVEKSASERTLRNYSQALAAFQSYMEKTLFPGWKQCTPDHFRSYLYYCMQLEMARSTIRLRFSALRSFFKYLVHRHGLPKSPLLTSSCPSKSESSPPSSIKAKSSNYSKRLSRLNSPNKRPNGSLSGTLPS